MRRAERWVAGPIAWGLAALVSACAGVAARPIAADRRPLGANEPRRPAGEPGRARPGRQCRQGDAGARAQPCARFGRQPEGAAHFRQRHPARPLRRGRHDVRALRLQFDLRSWRPCRRRHARAGFPSRPAILARPCSSGASPRAPLSSSPITVPRRCAIRSAGRWIRWRDPLGWVVGYWLIGWPWSVGSAAVSATAHLGQWKEAENASIDFYSFLRSDYYQTRRAQLREALGLPAVVESPATGAIAIDLAAV